MNVETHSQLASFIWSICNLLRGPYKRNEYRKVILPLTVLRRFDCLLAPTKAKVLAEHPKIKTKPETVVRSLLQKITRRPFYNLSKLDLPKLLDDPNQLAPNLNAYINGFSKNVREIMERFAFDQQIARMAEKNLLYEVIKKFAAVDLSPDRVDNVQMGYVFEELIRIGAEQSNEEAGEHFTPREVIKLMVNLLLSPEKDLRKSHVVKTIYDPACGTGGMLSVAEKYIRDLNTEADPHLFGQDWNDESWAVCKSDMLIKGEDADNIVRDDTFTKDGFDRDAEGRKRTFDYMLANPPFGVEWKQQQKYIEHEAESLGYDGRFGAGLPRINDGSLLFLQHMISKMRAPKEGGTPEEIRRFGLKVGDVVITKDSEEWSDIAVPALVVESAPDLVCGYHLAIVRPRETELLGGFLLRVFQACAVNQQFQMAATGVTRYGLPKSSIGEAWIPLPSASEQCTIADFLDRETAQIDTLVAKKRTLIERLKEKRTALISRTVTRGLPPSGARAAGIDPHPKLKPSGIDWLGDVPEHWEVKRLKHIVTAIEQGWSPDCDNAPAAPDEWGVLKAGCCNGGVFVPEENKALPADLDAPPRLEIQPGDILMSRASGSEDLVGSAALVPEKTRSRLLLSDKTYRLRCDVKKIVPALLARLLQSPLGRVQVQAFISGASGLAKNIAQSDVKELLFPIPPFAEQRVIADFLDRETAKVDAMVRKVETAIERLGEYRKALITAAVTGKIDVRSVGERSQSAMANAESARMEA